MQKVKTQKEIEWTTDGGNLTALMAVMVVRIFVSPLKGYFKVLFHHGVKQEV